MTEVFNFTKMTPNEWADYWRYKIGVNVIPADSRNKKTYEKWSIWQNSPISEEQHEKWKKENAFSKGMAIMPGRIWHRNDKSDLYFVFIDLDNQKALDEFCNAMDVKDLQELSRNMIVEQHKDDLSRAHLYFYSNHVFKKKSSDKSKFSKEIGCNDIPAIEVKSLGSHGIAMCCSSIHKNGFPYEIIGNLEPKTYGKELEQKLFGIYKKNNLHVDKNGIIPIEKLFEDDFVILEGHNRHEALLRVMESLIQKNKVKMSIKEIEDLSYQWNQNHCKPPLDNKEVAKLWVCAINFTANSNNDKSSALNNRKGREDPDNIQNQNNVKNPPIFKIIRQNKFPWGFYLDYDDNELCCGSIINGHIGQYYYNRTIIDIIPTNIIIYENPLFPNQNPIEIKFNNGLKAGPFTSTNDVIKFLDSKGHLLSKNYAHDALNCIISAFKERNLIELKKDVTTQGYYLLKEGIIKKDITQSDNIDKTDVKRCCEYLNRLVESGWKNKNIFPTVIKWGILSPFSFSIKFNSDEWFPWLQLYGLGQTGKTTLGYIVLNIWNLNNKNNVLGFNHIDSVARFGNIASKDTYPKLINEVGALLTNAYGKYTPIIELIKHSVESITVRGKYVDNNSNSFASYQETPALCPMIFTSNYQPLSDSGFNRRLVSIHFPKEEKKEESEQQQFKEDFEENKKYLRVLGDFVSKKVIENPKMLTEKFWKDLSIDLLVEFYKFADMEIPKWIYNFEEQRDAIDESNELTHFGLRAFLINKVNELYSRYFNIDSSEKERSINLTPISHKVQYCLRSSLISFLHQVDKDNMIITIDLMKELRNNNIENITSLKDIGTLLQFKYTFKNFGGKKMRVLEGRIDYFVKFLDSKIT